MKRHKRRKSRTKQIILLILSIEVLLIVSGLAYIQLRPMVVKAVTVEAGDQTLDVNRFLLYKKYPGNFVTDMQTLNTSIPGVYEIQIQVGKRVHTSQLEVVDTIAPTATISDQIALRGEVVDPKTFVTEVVDATQVTVSFQEEPDTTLPGEQAVTIVLVDCGKNKIEKTATLTILDIKSSVAIEAGSQMNITIADFVDNDKYDISFVTDLQKLDISKPVIHPIELNVNGRVISANIEVTDTTAPKATVKEQEVWKDEAPAASSFVSDIDDVSEVTVTYKQTPDFTKLGEQEITLVLADDFGNKTELPTTITVKEDTEAPVILGAADKLVYIGDSVSYKKGVSVTDNKDKELTFSVDNSDVNLKKEGTYTVTYSAIDVAGNKATKKINVEVKKFVVTEDMVNVLCDSVLNKIVKSNMTELDTAYAIYKWIKQHVSYSGDSDKSDWLLEAYRAMTDKEGDCFTYYAVAQALLTRAGIDNMGVTRVGGKTKHFWNLVDCGDGWYHFDSCPNKDHKESFMLTDKEVADLSKVRGNNYYNFDKSLYPATPEE